LYFPKASQKIKAVRHFKKSQKLHLGGGLLPMDFYRVDGFFMMEFYHNNVQTSGLESHKIQRQKPTGKFYIMSEIGNRLTLKLLWWIHWKPRICVFRGYSDDTSSNLKLKLLKLNSFLLVYQRKTFSHCSTFTN